MKTPMPPSGRSNRLSTDTGEVHIHDEPGLNKSEIVEFDAEPLADRAGRPVAGDDVARSDDRDMPEFIMQLQANGIGVLSNVVNRLPKLHLHRTSVRHCPTQQPLNFRLHEDHRRRPRLRVGRRNHVEAFDELTIDAVVSGIGTDTRF